MPLIPNRALYQCSRGLLKPDTALSERDSCFTVSCGECSLIIPGSDLTYWVGIQALMRDGTFGTTDLWTVVPNVWVRVGSPGVPSCGLPDDVHEPFPSGALG